MYIYLLLIMFCGHYIVANTLDVTNVTSGQVTINLQTIQQATPVQIVIPANINPILNDINEPDPLPTTITFDNSTVQKLSIIRFSPNMPQIIYYDNQNTADANQQVGGMKSLSLSVKQNKMLIWNDYVEINNVGYSLNDLDSYVVRLATLKNNLTPANSKTTQTLLEDVTTSINMVKQADMAPALAVQIAVIEALITSVSDALTIMQLSSQDPSNNQTPNKDLDKYVTQIQQLKDNLSLANLDATQQQLNTITTSLQTLKKSNPPSVSNLQIATVQAAINGLASDITITKTIQNKIKELENLQSNLALGDNNLKGTNKPYKPANDSIDRAQRTLNGLKRGLPTLTQAHVDTFVTQQIQALESSMHGLQSAIDQMQTSRRAINYEDVLPPVTDLQTFQNT